MWRCQNFDWQLANGRFCACAVTDSTAKYRRWRQIAETWILWTCRDCSKCYELHSQNCERPTIQFPITVCNIDVVLCYYRDSICKSNYILYTQTYYSLQRYVQLMLLIPVCEFHQESIECWIFVFENIMRCLWMLCFCVCVRATWHNGQISVRFREMIHSFIHCFFNNATCQNAVDNKKKYKHAKWSI